MKTAVCPFCGKKTDTFIMFRGDVVGCKYCGIHTKSKTNADRIRAMTDEELVEFLLEESECPCYGHKLCTGEDDLPCEKILLKWLKQEASDA